MTSSERTYAINALLGRFTPQEIARCVPCGVVLRWFAGGDGVTQEEANRALRDFHAEHRHATPAAQSIEPHEGG